MDSGPENKQHLPAQRFRELLESYAIIENAYQNSVAKLFRKAATIDPALTDQAVRCFKSEQRAAQWFVAIPGRRSSLRDRPLQLLAEGKLEEVRRELIALETGIYSRE